jgi:hypothetical protein
MGVREIRRVKGERARASYNETEAQRMVSESSVEAKLLDVGLPAEGRQAVGVVGKAP